MQSITHTQNAQPAATAMHQVHSTGSFAQSGDVEVLPAAEYLRCVGACSDTATPGCDAGSSSLRLWNWLQVCMGMQATRVRTWASTQPFVPPAHPARPWQCRKHDLTVHGQGPGDQVPEPMQTFEGAGFPRDILSEVRPGGAGGWPCAWFRPCSPIRRAAVKLGRRGGWYDV